MASTNMDKPLFQELSAEQEPEVTEIESLCMQCHKDVCFKHLIFNLL